MKAVTLSVAIVLYLFGASGLHAAELTGHQKVQMIEAARLDCLAQLARQIRGVFLEEESIAANNALAESVRALKTDALVMGTVLGEPEFVGDVCLVEGEITLRRVIENLTTVIVKKGLQTTVVSEATRNFQYETFRARGAGTIPAPQDAEADPAPKEDIVDAQFKTIIAQVEGPGQSKLAATEAARMDAMVQLLRQIKGVYITDESLVADMIKESRWTEAQSRGFLKGAKVINWRVVDKDLVSCTMQVTIEQIIEHIEDVARETATTVSVSQVREVNKNYVTVTGTGYGSVGKGQVKGPLLR